MTNGKSVNEFDVLTRADNTPVRDDSQLIKYNESGVPIVTRVMLGTATTGLVRFEWHNARQSQIIPMNWGYVGHAQHIPSYNPLGYMVADAQNLIVRAAVEGDYEWLILHEHDVILPPTAFFQLNDYIRRGDVPIVSGLYFSRHIPSDPLIFRGRGTSVYTDWFKNGESKVWCDGVPTGILLIHMSILRAMWEESEEYVVFGEKVRRVFETPQLQYIDRERPDVLMAQVGTSDLEWCTRIMQGGFFKKAGWDDYEGKQYPFLVDTDIFCMHINPDGKQFPPEGQQYWQALLETRGEVPTESESEPEPLQINLSETMTTGQSFGPNR